MTEGLLSRAEEIEDTMKGLFLTFDLDTETYGIDIAYVTEIIGIQTISKLPETPAYIRGIINLRGKIIPVIDMRIKFKKEQKADSDRTSIVVIETQQFSAGLIVDQVTEVITLNDADVAPPPDLQAGVSCPYLSGIGKQDDKVVILLNCEALFNDEEARLLRESKKQAAV